MTSKVGAIKGLSLFSGIGGFDLAMERAGINLAGMCEIDKNAQVVLRKHFPNVPLYDDVREIGENTHERGTIDIICGGFPCQDVSIAGKRAGLVGERSGLWFDFARIIDELEPGWVVIENVPGLLSSNKGADFAVILQWLVERGYGVSWRILDAQNFGVPQRRRRVFIITSFGNGRSAEVLFEQTSLSGYSKPSREERKAAASTFTIRSGKDGGGKGYLGSDEQAMTLGGQPQWTYSIHRNEDKRKDRPNGGFYLREDDASPTLQTSFGKSHTLVFANNVAGTLAGGSSKAHSDMTSVQQDGNVIVSWQMNHVGVRRLTPIECERLQGFEDGWTDGQADTQRYKQLGNAVAVPVVQWIIDRIVKSAVV